jgi:hypothetical protein
MKLQGLKLRYITFYWLNKLTRVCARCRITHMPSYHALFCCNKKKIEQQYITISFSIILYYNISRI